MKTGDKFFRGEMGEDDSFSWEDENNGGWGRGKEEEIDKDKRGGGEEGKGGEEGEVKKEERGGMWEGGG